MGWLEHPLSIQRFDFTVLLSNFYTYSQTEKGTYFRWHDHATMVQRVEIRHDQHQVAGFFHRQKSGPDDGADFDSGESDDGDGGENADCDGDGGNGDGGDVGGNDGYDDLPRHIEPYGIVKALHGSADGSDQLICIGVLCW